MAYEDPQIVQEWLDSLGELDVKVKKMFGCYCLNGCDRCAEVLCKLNLAHIGAQRVAKQIFVMHKKINKLR